MADRGGAASTAGRGRTVSRRRSSAEDDLEKNAATLLAKHSLEEFDIPLQNIVTAENSRQTNPTAVASIKQSIVERGWMPGHCPKVMFNDMHEGQITQEEAKNRTVVVIDGNHRVEALKQCRNGDFLVRCLCYKTISDIFERKIVSEGE